MGSNMNLYLRLIFTLLRAWRLPRFDVGTTLERTFRVLPNDIDMNGHMNNGRYMTIVDLMLMEYFVRIGFAGVLIKQGWRPMSGGSFITYRRGLKPFQTYRLRYRIDACDEFWNFMRFEFLDGDKVCASGYMKGAAVGKQGLVPNTQSYAALGLEVLPNSVPEPVQHWLAAEKSVIAMPWIGAV
jgi:acyl-CoA thioesterase FadM